MTVSSTTTKASYSGNGSTTVFAVPFYFLQNADLLVILRSAAGVETTQVLGTNYTLTGAGNENGGSLTMTVAPPTGTTLTILRNAAATQETDLLPNDRLPAESLETALDKLTMLVQQLDEESARSIKFAVTDASTSSTLPTSSQRANKFLSFDNNGNPIVTGNTDTYTVSEEVKIATQGQTVFTLTTMSYIPGINNLSVFVDGVNQYRGTAYTETSSTSVTFSQGLHAGAVVKFSTVRTLSSDDPGANNVMFLQAGTGAVARSVQAKLRDTVSVKDYGAAGDYSNDDTAAIQAAFNAGVNVYFPPGNYIVTGTINVPTNKRTVFHGAGSNNSVIYYRPPLVGANLFNLPDGDNIEFRDLGFTLQNPLASINCFEVGNAANSIRWRRCEFTYWNRAAIRHATAEYDVIEDCRFVSCTDTTNTTRARAIWFNTYANTVTISGCRFSGNDSNIYAAAGSALRVENCSFEGNGDTPNIVVYQDTTTFINVKGLTFSGNYVEGEKPAATYAAVSFSGCTGVFVSANTFSGDFGGVEITDTFLLFRDNCRNITVENNWFNNPKDYVARWLTTDIIKFYNNRYTDGFASTPVTSYSGIMALMNAPNCVELDVPFTFTYNPGSLNDGDGETSAEQDVSGVRFGDFVMASAPESLQGVLVTPYVSASNRVRVRLQNETGGTIDLGSGTWKVRVFKAYV
jgi:hypothetical protein